jgi:hypothetical protein
VFDRVAGVMQTRRISIPDGLLKLKKTKGRRGDAVNAESKQHAALINTPRVSPACLCVLGASAVQAFSAVC